MGYTKDYLIWLYEQEADDDEDMEDFLDRLDDEGAGFERMDEFVRDELADEVEWARGEVPRWDVFLSYAGERKDELARPLVVELRKLGLEVWFDEDDYPDSSTWQGILYRFVNEGIAWSNVGVVIVSPEYLEKDWTNLEYSGLHLKGAESLFYVLHDIDHEALGTLHTDLPTILEERRSASAQTGDEPIAAIAARIAGVVKSTGRHAERRKTAAKYELHRSSDGQTYFNLKAANGRVILTSQRYKRKANANRGIESVRTNSPDDGCYDRRRSRTGQPHFVLKAANGEIIGRSEMYSSASAMNNGIESVKTNAPAARVVDLTTTGST